jgi:hypothetical protein
MGGGHDVCNSGRRVPGTVGFLVVNASQPAVQRGMKNVVLEERKLLRQILPRFIRSVRDLPARYRAIHALLF